jgi:hypothetical protein
VIRGDHHHAAHEPADNLPEGSGIQRLLIDWSQGCPAVIDYLVSLRFSLAFLRWPGPDRSAQQ